MSLGMIAVMSEEAAVNKLIVYYGILFVVIPCLTIAIIVSLLLKKAIVALGIFISLVIFCLILLGLQYL